MKKSTAHVGVLVTLWALTGGVASAQSAFFIDDVLDEEVATFGRIVHLALASAQLVDDIEFPDATLDVVTLATLAEQGWGLEIKNKDDPITLGEYTFLLMQAFDLRGGIMYSLFPGPRYAAREFAYRGLVPGSTSPYRYMSGEEVVQILGRTLSTLEAERGN